MTEKELSEFVGKQVEITFTDNDVIIGECFNFTDSYDNDPETASISVKTNDNRVIEVSQDEIKFITVTD